MSTPWIGGKLLFLALACTIASAGSAGRGAVATAAVESSGWWFGQAAQQARAADDWTQRALSCQTIGLAQNRLGDFDAATETAGLLDARTLPEGEDDRFGFLASARDTILCSAAVLQARAGEIERARLTLREVQSERVAAAALVEIIRAAARASWFEAALELAGGIEVEAPRRQAFAAIAVELASHDRIEEARHLLAAIEGSFLRDQVTAALARAYAKAGDYSAAEALLPAIQTDHLQLEAIAGIGSQRTRNGDVEGAREFADRRGLRKSQATALRAIGEMQFQLGDISRAWATVYDAHDAAERIGRIDDRWRCALDIGKTRLRIGDRAGALESFAAARDAIVPMMEPQELSEAPLKQVRITVSSSRAIGLALIAAAQARAGDERAAAMTMSYVGPGETMDQATLLYVQGLADAAALGTAERQAFRITDRSRRNEALQAIAYAAAASEKGELDALADWMRSMPEPSARVAVCVGAAEGLAARPVPPAVQASRNTIPVP